MEPQSTVQADMQKVDKLAWESPTIEELDFSATESNYIPGAPVDFGIYTA
jgi:hypothetical protein